MPNFYVIIINNLWKTTCSPVNLNPCRTTCYHLNILYISSFRGFGTFNSFVGIYEDNINTYDGFQHTHDTIFVLNTSLVTFGFLRKNNTYNTS